MRKIEDWKKMFGLVSVGQIFSIIGSSAAQFAIIWWLTIETGSALTLSYASVAGYLPQAIIGLFAGVWIDRYDRKKIMMLADGFVALSSAVLALAFVFDFASIPLIFAVLAARSVGSAFHAPAYTAAIPMFVPQDKLMKTGGWNQLVTSGSALLGPVIGAFLMGFFSLQAIMLVDIVGAALAILSLTFVKIPAMPPKKDKINIVGDMKEAFATVRRNKPLMAVLAPMIIVVMTMNPLASLLPLMVSSHFGGGVWHNSLGEICFSVGTILGSIAMGIWANGKKQFGIMSIACLVMGGVGVVSGLLPASFFPVFAVLVFFMGLANTGLNVPIIAYLQRTTDPAMMGKVMSLFMSIIGISVPIGLAVAGPIAEYLGIGVWFIVAGALTIAAGIYTFFKALKYDKALDAELPRMEAAGD